VIGAGPSGLMAADILSAAGHSVLIADAMPSPARKFLMAGKSGLNLTKVGSGFIEAFGDIPDSMVAALNDFGPDQVIEWANGLGQEVFIGSTGRVFPVVMKASPLLRAWLKRLDAQKVTLYTRWRWTGWDQDNWVFETPTGTQSVSADIVILAFGGASWARLGSDGHWAEKFSEDTAPFKPANMGFVVSWSDHMTPHFGSPVKGCTLMAGAHQSSGEFVISSRGLEGGGVYAISAAVRDGAPLTIDLLPSLSVEDIRAKLSRKGKESLSNVLRKSLRLDPVKIALLNEFGRPFPSDLAKLIKELPVRHGGPRPMDEAISVAGGLRFDALDDGFMMHRCKGVFCVGEMLDWEAPTGGYLITGCLATGRHAALAAIEYAAQCDAGGQ
jgi:uncharacterized flavoprotein (TIGR03862 family)